MKLILKAIIIFVFNFHLFADILNVPSEYASIKDAINSANEGDTVLVAPGTYKEFITLNSKNLTLASYYLTKGDTSYISKTILDGGGKRMIFYCYAADTSTMICGFTFSNGHGDFGSAVYLYDSSPRLLFLKIENNISYGETSNFRSGAIYLDDSSPRLQNVIIRNNSTNGSGGAIYSHGGAPELKNVLIENNRASFYGGGLYIESDMKLSDVTIKNNTALYYGGGIFIYNWSTNYNIEFDQVNRCNVFLNYAPVGSDFYSVKPENITAVYLDTMTVSVPTEKYAHTPEGFTFDIQNSKIEFVSQNVYVSPNGDNSNPGTSPDQPLKSITYALLKVQSDSLNTGTINLANGIYSPLSTQENFPLFPGNNIILSGESQQGVIINPESSGNAFRLYENKNASKTNLTLTRGKSTNGGGIELLDTELFLSAVTIRNNSAQNGGGIYIENWLTNYKIEFDQVNRCNIYNNYAQSGTEIASYSFENSNLNVVVDTFTVLYPTSYHIKSYFEYGFDALHAKVQQVDQDVYVSAVGNNQNSGLSPADPIKSIELAFSMILADSSNPHTIFLADGKFSPSTTNTLFPMYPPEYIAIKGTDKNLVILDAEQSGPVIMLSKEGNGLENVTVSGGYNVENGGGVIYSSPAIMKNVIITDNESMKTGGGVYCSGSFILENIIISDNSAYRGGGIGFESSASSTIVNSYISGNYARSRGGGLYYYGSGYINIEKSHFEENTADENGGGIYITNNFNDNADFKDLIVQNNSAKEAGGGIYSSAFVELSSCIIRHNQAKFGGGIRISSFTEFNDENLCNIYYNNGAIGSDIYISDWHDPFAIDTFTVAKPTTYHYYKNSGPLTVLNCKIDQIEQDIYVSPSGNNNNSGLSPAHPFETVSNALLKIYADSSNHRTIHLADGTYKPSEEEFFPLNVPSFITLKGSSRTNTILDGENRESILYMGDEFKSWNKISDLSIVNGFSESDNIIYSNARSFYGPDTLLMENVLVNKCTSMKSILNARECYLVLNSVEFIDNSAFYIVENYNPINVFNSSFVNNNCLNTGLSSVVFTSVAQQNSPNINFFKTLIAKNTNFEYSIYIPIRLRDTTNLSIINSTIGYNTNLNPKYDNAEINVRGIYLKAQILNSIIWSDREQVLYSRGNTDTIVVAYSDIKGGIDKFPEAGAVIWDAGNISENPLFTDTLNADFSLLQNSPCVNAGTDFFQWDGDTIVDLDPSEYYGSAPDMGAIENTDPADIDDPGNRPFTYKLKQNYPNPFNPLTTIEYSIKNPGRVKIVIFNALGEIVKTLLDKKQAAGNYRVSWNASHYASGIYFYQIQAGKFKSVKKMLLIK